MPPKIRLSRRELRGDRSKPVYDWRYVYGYTVRGQFQTAIRNHKETCKRVFAQYEADVRRYGYSFEDVQWIGPSVLDHLPQPVPKFNERLRNTPFPAMDL